MSFEADQEDNKDPTQLETSQGGTGLGQASQQSAPGSQTDVSLGGGGTGVVAGSAPGGQAMGSSTDKPSSSGSWTNLQSYLDANKDQAGQLGSQVAGNVQSQVNQAQGDISNASSDFRNQVDANTVKQDDTAVNQAITDAQNAKAGSTYDPNELAGYQNQANASYGGPTDFTQGASYGQAQDSSTKANQAIQGLGSEAGRGVLLQDQFGKNGYYNQGEQSLDQLLLEGNPQNQQTFADLRAQNAGLPTALSDATTAGGQYAQNAVQTDAATAAAAKAALDSANTNWQAGLNTQLAGAQQGYQSANDAIKAALSKGNLTPDQLQQTGLQGGTTTMGLDLSKYLSPGTSPTLYNTANADQYAQAAALAQLAGPTGANFLPSDYAGQAGSAGNPWSYNTNQFNSDRATALGEYNSALSNTSVNPSVGGPMSLKDWLNTIPTNNSNADWNGPINQAIAKINEIGKNYGQGSYYLSPDKNAPAGYDLSQNANQTVNNWDPILNTLGDKGVNV